MIWKLIGGTLLASVIITIVPTQAQQRPSQKKQFIMETDRWDTTRLRYNYHCTNTSAATPVPEKAIHH